MNYSQCDKMVSDMEAEVDSVYKIALMMIEYVKSRDMDPYDPITDELRKDIVMHKKNIMASLLYSIDAYKKCDKVHVRNETIVDDRKAMNKIINHIKIKILSSSYDLDNEVMQMPQK